MFWILETLTLDLLSINGKDKYKDVSSHMWANDLLGGGLRSLSVFLVVFGSGWLSSAGLLLSTLALLLTANNGSRPAWRVAWLKSCSSLNRSSLVQARLERKSFRTSKVCFYLVKAECYPRGICRETEEVLYTGYWHARFFTFSV